MADGFVIIKHQVFREISDEEVLKLLPTDKGVPNVKIFDIKREIISMESIHLLNSFEYRIYQKNIIENEVRPYLSAHPDARILYFGTATIPLALHLGYCFGSWRDVEVYQLQRENPTWNWFNDSDKKELPIVSNFVKEEFNGPIDVIFKVEATYNAHDAELKEVVKSPHKMISMQLEKIEKDAFRNLDQLKSFAHQFSLGIDSIANYLPNADKIHLFPTVPVGLAFLMGAKINPNVTKPIVTYQYNTNRTPKYEQVLTLQESIQQEINISEEDQKFIDEVKIFFRDEIENRIAPFAKSKIEERRKNSNLSTWTQLILPEGKYSEMEKGLWKTIPDAPLTILSTSTLSYDTDLATEGFHISERNEWQLSDRFIFNISQRLGNDKTKILRALRLFLFHESLHIYQKLTNYTAANIGRFPRILEEADYIADVWAMIFEYSYSKLHHASEANDVKLFFNKMIDVAIKTMWAFDDLDANTEEMQIRRVNRYLIWYWNYLQIEDRSCETLEQIINILANKPLLELKGLDIRAQSQRTIFKLTSFKPEELELAQLDVSGKITRLSNSGNLQISEMIKGFKERNGDKILTQLKSFHHQTRNS